MRLVAQASRNAVEALDRRLAETTTQGKLLREVAELFELADTPARIEVYDNSHIQGTNALGAMVVAGPEGFIKNQYRKWNIKKSDTAPGDDFAMMREVMERRFGRLLDTSNSAHPERSRGTKPSEAEASQTSRLRSKESLDFARDERDDDKNPDYPDLLLIDGGKGQVSAVKSVLDELGIDDVPFIGISKGPDRHAGRETFHFPDGREFNLPINAPVLFYLQRLRDEVHRFAIGAHRNKRAKAITTSPLDDVPGIGPARKKALLMHFGTARAVRDATLEDLARAPGVSAAVAQTVHDFYRGG